MVMVEVEPAHPRVGRLVRELLIASRAGRLREPPIVAERLHGRQHLRRHLSVDTNDADHAAAEECSQKESITPHVEGRRIRNAVTLILTTRSVRTYGSQ